MTDLSVALADNEVLMRFLIARTRYGRELSFSCLDESYIGFVTAVDPIWVQVVRPAQGLSTVVVRLQNVTAVGETGRTLDDLDRRAQKVVRKYVRPLAKAVAQENPDQGEDNDNGPGNGPD